MKHLIAVMIAVLVLWGSAGWYFANVEADEITVTEAPEGFDWSGYGPGDTETHFIVPTERVGDVVICGTLITKDRSVRMEVWPAKPPDCPYQIRIERVHKNEVFTVPEGWEYVETVVGGYSFSGPRQSGGVIRTYIVLRRRVCE